MRSNFCCLILAVLLVSAAASAEPDQPAGRNVLVVYQADSPDNDGNGKGDSLDLAEHYAQRRGVPADNLLGVATTADGKPIGKWDYRTAFERIIKPVWDKLAEKGDGGRRLAEQICYIVTVPGVPDTLDYGFVDKASKDWPRKTARRSVDQFLISLEDNVRAGVDEKLNAPGAGRTGPLGSEMSELTLATYGAFLRGSDSFVQLRKGNPGRFNFYMVTRLGKDIATGRQMLDNSLYAERYLRLAGQGADGSPRPHIWLDQKLKFAADQVASMHRAVAIVQGQGLADNPFAANRGLRAVWPLVIDNHLDEIGLTPKDATQQHRPVVSGKIVEVNEGAGTIRLDGKASRPGETPAVLYFTVGSEVSNGKATARVTGLDVAANGLRVDRCEGFHAGDEITAAWPGRFPTNDCFIFYGFYGLGRYEDVFQFLPGAIGIHVDSSCMNWARWAMQRNIAATFGVTSEPLSAGIPHGDLAILALARGRNWAEAVYGSLRLGQRWAGVAFGDPLYTPFASLQFEDKTPPVLASVSAKPAIRGVIVVSAELGGKSDDELADVAMFKVEYGQTKSYGQTVEFVDWPEPENSSPVAGRRFGYARRFSIRLTGLTSDRTMHYRVTARDPAGNETVSEDKTFVVP